MNDIEKKLKDIIAEFNNICIAFSGGVDSSLLLFLTQQERPVTAIIIDGPMVKREDIKRATEFAQTLPNVKLVRIPFDVFEIPEFSLNSKNRCYYCKKALFERILEVARKNQCDVVFDGTNTDDLSDFRPGMKAITELNIISPFLEAGINKNDIYYLSNKYNLPTKNKPASACLASRIQVDEKITPEMLEKVEAGEELLEQLGFKQYRLRLINPNNGYIEVLREDFPLFNKYQKTILNKLDKLGVQVEAKPRVYQTGSMNKRS